MHELPGEITDNTADETTPGPSVPTSEDQSLVSAVLIAHIEVLEAENTMLKTCLSSKETTRFGIKHDDHSFYTVFSSYRTLMAFFHFLGPTVNKLHYWGT